MNKQPSNLFGSSHKQEEVMASLCAPSGVESVEVILVNWQLLDAVCRPSQRMIDSVHVLIRKNSGSGFEGVDEIT